MLFHSTTFGIFFCCVFAGFWLLHRWRMPRVLFLLAASYLFYMGWSAKFALLILFSTVVDYVIGLLLGRTERPAYRNLLMAASVIINLGVLGLFKYYNFFVDSAVQALQHLGVHASAPTLQLVLPVGISFYTFQSLSYTIDVYRRQLQPTKNFLEFALFIVFFPQLVAGPIVRASEFLPQLNVTPRFSLDAVRSGLLLLFIGLFKKVVIADVLAETLVDKAFAQAGAASGRHLLLGTYGYAFQIYGDFSGYTDCALGVARMLGYELPINFDLPYRATSVRDFWRRWHISLSTFLRDYLYFPLGGSRGGVLMTCRNLFITMVLAGLWHGAAWNFVLFGVYHGVLLSGETLWRVWTGRKGDSDTEQPWYATAFWTIVTFHVLCVGLVIFRAQSVADIGVIYSRILSWAPAAHSEIYPHERGIWILLLAMALHYLPRRWPALAARWVESCPPLLQGGLAVIALGVLGVFISAHHPFVYFQF